MNYNERSTSYDKLHVTIAIPFYVLRWIWKIQRHSQEECTSSEKCFMHLLYSFVLKHFRKVNLKMHFRILQVFYLVQSTKLHNNDIFVWMICIYRTLQAYFEKWLRMILRWDPKSRGHGLVDNRPKCFTFLDTILNMKVMLFLFPVIHQKVLQGS